MKVTQTKLLDTARIFMTKMGQEAPWFFTYLAEFIEQQIRALRNNLSFDDNFACDVKTVSLTHNQAQNITASKVAKGMIPVRVVSKAAGIAGFEWYYDDNNRLTVKALFTAGAGTTADVVIVILF